MTDSVSKVVVNTGNGNDKVSYTLTGNLTTARTIVIKLGNGKDSATLAFDTDNDLSPLTISNKLRILVDGGNGDDTLSVAVDVVLGNPPGPGPDLVLDLRGGNAKDTLTAGLTLRDGSTGDLDVDAIGGNGSDSVRLTLDDQTDGDGVSDVSVGALLNVGLGTDACTRTANVAASGCETTTLVVRRQ